LNSRIPTELWWKLEQSILERLKSLLTKIQRPLTLEADEFRRKLWKPRMSMRVEDSKRDSWKQNTWYSETRRWSSRSMSKAFLHCGTHRRGEGIFMVLRRRLKKPRKGIGVMGKGEGK